MSIREKLKQRDAFFVLAFLTVLAYIINSSDSVLWKAEFRFFPFLFTSLYLLYWLYFIFKQQENKPYLWFMSGFWLFCAVTSGLIAYTLRIDYNVMTSLLKYPFGLSELVYGSPLAGIRFVVDSIQHFRILAMFIALVFFVISFGFLLKKLLAKK